MATLDQLPPQLLLAICTAPAVIHRGNAALGIHGGRRSFAQHSKGGIPGHALDGADLARLAAVSRYLSCAVREFGGRSVAEEAARQMLLLRCRQGLLRPGHWPMALDIPRRCAVDTPCGRIPMTWAGALGPWTAPLTLRSDPRRVDTSAQGRALLEMVRDDLAPDGCTAAVRRGMTSGTAISSSVMKKGRHLVSFTILEGKVAVGVCTPQFDPSGLDLYASMTSHAWCWDPSDGHCVHGAETTRSFDVVHGSCQNSSVGLLLDCAVGCLWAFKDGHRLGLVAHDLPVGMGLMWCVEVKGRGCALVRRCPSAAVPSLNAPLRFSAKCTDLAALGALGAAAEGEEDPVNEC
eukprot:COSAG02_NODE_330_length_24501_cov_39.465850_29_plen_349_part_00